MRKAAEHADEGQEKESGAHGNGILARSRGEQIKMIEDYH
jgi:hypothetical protein